MDFLKVMQERGLVAQVTHEDELAAHLKSGPRTAYIGFDPTAPSLHVGGLMQIMTLRRWQKAGHRVIALVGGGTVLVGDPTGKSEMRQMLTQEQIAQNMVGIKAQLQKFLEMNDPAKGILVNNADWLKKLNYLELLREIGPHFSVNRMLSAECFKQRWEKGLSFLEFNYMILQSYDFLHLFRNEGCTVQMGGDDQWSNILSGMELVRRLGGETVGAAKAFALTSPLLTTSDGKKMGKTEKGAVWLDPELTSPYEYFQFWRNVEDARVAHCLATFTDLPMTEVQALAALEGSEINKAKVVLAFETTKMLHGEAAAEAAKATAEQLFKGGAVALTGDEPEFVIDRTRLGQGLPLGDVLVESKAFPSKGEIRRLIQQGGLLLNGQKVEDINISITEADFTAEGRDGALFRKGKKHYFRLRIA